MLFSPKERGQGVVEIALIIEFVALILILVFLVLGPILGKIFSKINSNIVVGV